jgi:hypothetical protein
VEHQTNDVSMTVQPSALIVPWNEMTSGELDAGITAVYLEPHITRHTVAIIRFF